MWWAERFGWPPQVVGKIPALRAIRLKAATQAVDGGRRKAEDAARRKAERNSGRR